MMDRHDLRYFLAVVDTGNFSRAAAACNVSQPTLSVAIAKMERSLGRSLFIRTNRRVALTDAGARLILHARSIASEFAAAERAIAGTAPTRTLRLGVLSSTPRRWIEDFLRGHMALASADQIEIVEGKDRELRERLTRGRIDVALTILNNRLNPHVSQHLFTEGYSLALSANHALAGKDIILIQDIAKDPMIVRRHCEILPETSRFFTTRGVRPVFLSRTTNDDRSLSYVRAGLGVTIMPDCFRETGVARIHLEGFDFVRDIGLAYAQHVDADELRQTALIASLIDAIGTPLSD